MVSWSANLARRDREFLIYATIQGIGDGNGLWRFSTETGWDLTSGQGTWKPYLTEFPDILSEQVPFFEGGAIESNAGVELSIVDKDEELTNLLGPDFGASSFTSSPIDSSQTSFSVDILPPEFASLELANGDMLWLGSEAVEIVSRASGPPATITVVRGRLGTVPVAHDRGTAIFIKPRVIEMREIRVYLAPITGSESDTRLVGVYTVEDFGLSDTHASWLFSGPAREPYLSRRCPRDPLTARVALSFETENNPDSFFLQVTTDEAKPAEVVLGGGQFQTFMNPDDKEILRLLALGRVGLSAGAQATRSHAGTELEELPKPGTTLRRVLSVANEDFRATSVAQATSTRTSANFQPVTSWVEVLLCVMTSPPLVSGTATNYNTSGTGWDGRNFSGLPTGYGIGVPWQDINFDSFQQVALSEANFDIPFFVLGQEIQTFSDVFDPILKAAGAFLVREKGEIRLVAPELPLSGNTPTFTINADTVLMRDKTQPAINTKRTNIRASEMNFKLGPQQTQTRAISLGDIPRLFDPEDLFLLDGRSVDIEAPFLDPDSLTYRDIGIRQLRRLYTNFIELDLDLEGSFFDMALGDNATVDLPGVPNFRGVRGLQGIGQLAELEVVAEKERSLKCRVKVYVQPTANVGKIGPAADITGVTGNVCTVAANTYTATDAPSPLPTNDALAFTVGDVVKLVNASGVPFPGVQEVTGRSTSSITLDGDFSNELAIGTTLIYADYSEVTLRQTNEYVFFDRNWRFG